MHTPRASDVVAKAKTFIKTDSGVPIVAQGFTNPTSFHEDMGSIPGFTQWVKNPGVAVAVV